MLSKPIEDHSGEEILDAVESIHREQVEGSSTIFRCAAKFARIHAGAAADATARVLPGTERAVRLGGAGTPAVMEFAAAELGARMQMGSVAARYYLADALDVYHRLPLLAARVDAGEVKVSYARQVAKQTRHLSPEAAARVDASMAPVADGSLPWSRFCDRLEGRIVAADPEQAARREAEEAAREVARATRSSADGMKGFYLRAPTAWVVRLDATVAYLAAALKELGDRDDEDRRRVKACLILANPTQAVEVLAAVAGHRSGAGREDDPLPADDPLLVPQPFRPVDLPAWLRHQDRPAAPPTGPHRFALSWTKLLPAVWLYLHVARETVERDRGGVVRWEGEGPVSWAYVRDRIAPFHDVKLTPVLDLADQAPVDAYEIPDRHRRAVHLRTPADSFPYSSNTSRRVDIDHTEPYRAPEPGQSRPDNYTPLGRFHHRIKTHGRWLVKQPFAGVYVWRDPHGHLYLVDHTGTHKVTPPGPRAGPPEPVPHDVGVHVHPAHAVLEYDGTAHAA